ncbi:MAG: hypothetical protein Sapg2KO_11980 [Saprospiraceae bacterium]
MLPKNFLTIFYCFCLLPLTAQSTFKYSGYESEKEVAEEMAKSGIPGLSIAIIRDFTIDTILQWGYADLETQTSVQKATLFQAGSMTSGLTAVAVLQAVEEGKIELDTDINQYLKSWKLTGGKYNAQDPVTVRDLLLKRRGFTQNQKPKGYPVGSEIPNLIEILNGSGPTNTKPVKLRSKTHAQENYSFETEIILMQLLEDVYEQDFRSLLQEKVLDPTGMNQSSLNLQLSQAEAARAATGYNEENQALAGKHLIFPEVASAGLWTTAEDYARFTLALIQAYQGSSDSILSAQIMQEALQKGHQSKALVFNNWGPGQTFGYGGAPQGYYSTVEANPEEGWGIVILCNKHLQWQFVNELRHGLKQKYSLVK